MEGSGGYRPPKGGQRIRHKKMNSKTRKESVNQCRYGGGGKGQCKALKLNNAETRLEFRIKVREAPRKRQRKRRIQGGVAGT